jgi:hypothetical protein
MHLYETLSKAKRLGCELAGFIEQSLDQVKWMMIFEEAKYMYTI